MADRGFKHIDNMLAEKRRKLVRPPNVASGLKLSRGGSTDKKKSLSINSY